MRVLRFTETDTARAQALVEEMTAQINTWSRLQHLCDDPDYVTEPFPVSIWKQHTITPGVRWLDYDSIFANLGDAGRNIADCFVGSVASPGYICRIHNCNLSLVDVADPVWEGYLPTPPDIIMP